MLLVCGDYRKVPQRTSKNDSNKQSSVCRSTGTERTDQLSRQPVGQVYNPINISKESKEGGKRGWSRAGGADRCIGNGNFYPNDIQEAKSLTMWGHGGWLVLFHARDIPNLMHLPAPLVFVDKPFGLACHVGLPRRYCVNQTNF